MICNQCGNELSDTAKFCGNCGTSVSVTGGLGSSQICPSCRTQIQPGTRFCTACGQTLRGANSQVAATPPSQSITLPLNELMRRGGEAFVEIREKSSSGQKLSLASAILVLVCFFLPWVEVSCMGLRESLSGYQLATGSQGYSGLSGLWLILLGMILVVGLIYSQIKRKMRNAQQEKQFTYGVIGTGGLGLVIILYEYISAMSELRRGTGGFGPAVENMVSFQFGAIASLLGCAAVLLGGLFHLGVDVRTVVNQVSAHGSRTSGGRFAGPDQMAPETESRSGPLAPPHHPPQQRVCSSCGSSLRANATFCGNCGARVERLKSNST